MAESANTSSSNNNTNNNTTTNNSNNNNISNTSRAVTGTGKVCYNVKCGATSSPRWRVGWHLRCGKIADLCDDCGLKYEQMKFCDTFHSNDDGWRNCNICNKHIHCGCIASFYSFTLADTQGIECITCVNKNGAGLVPSNISHPVLLPSQKILDQPQSNLAEVFGPKHLQNTNPKSWLQVPNLWQSLTGQPTGNSLNHIHEMDKVNFEQSMEKASGESSISSLRKMENDLSERIKTKDLKLGIIDGSFLDTSKELNPPDSSRIDLLSGELVTQDTQLENASTSCLNISLGSLVSQEDPPTAVLGLAICSGSPDDIKEPIKAGASQLSRQRRQILPKPSIAGASDSAKELNAQIRIARPPGEGRGRSQLLPRYWPRITDQELQQISGDSNSVITPLFEKMLSASDAGRIGRLVLPKACAEAYFPPISQPEGLPLKIQDAKGKDWVFQFRFWPNNNSRMYVLEGVTPCIQSMQLQAGDTVTFSRIDPEGKLVMGFRKATNSSPQEGQQATTGNGTPIAAALGNGNIENVSSLESFSSLPLRSVNGNSGPEMSSYSGQLNASDSAYNWYKNDKMKGTTAYQHFLAPEKFRNYTPGFKSKRLRIDNEDSLELKLTWEEAQELLRPPPKAVPSIVMIEGHEFEEYEEPPVFGKRTLFTTSQTGETNQWAQCDECCSWRRLPIDAFLPPRWTCAENTWDSMRASCSAAQEVTSEELEKLIKLNAGSKKVDNLEGQNLEPSSGLDTLANVAVLGENNGASTLAATTTKHPRHRPGCTCIVCIQPPSGKGPKHKPTCTCNVCMTVKRRFKTLMMRRKKRQSEREAENAKKKRPWIKEEGEVNSGSNWQPEMCSPSDNSTRQDNSLTLKEGFNIPIDDKINSDMDLSLSPKVCAVTEKSSTGKGQIDLNSQPDKDEELLQGLGRVSMLRLLQDASLPLEMYLKQQGLASLAPQPTNLPNAGFEENANEQRIDDQCGTPSNAQNQDEVHEEQFMTPNRVKSDGTSVSG